MAGTSYDSVAWLDSAFMLGLLLMGAVGLGGLLWHSVVPIVRKIRIQLALNAAMRAAGGWPPEPWIQLQEGAD